MIHLLDLTQMHACKGEKEMNCIAKLGKLPRSNISTGHIIVLKTPQTSLTPVKHRYDKRHLMHQSMPSESYNGTRMMTSGTVER